MIRFQYAYEAASKIISVSDQILETLPELSRKMKAETASFYGTIQRRLTSDLNNLNEKIASGKEIHHPLDDPMVFMDSMQLKTALARLDQYERNLKMATSRMTMSESALNNTLNLMERKRDFTAEIGLRPQNAETRATAAVEVGALLAQAISLGNT
jgi:flagellin-like hook-associated protein FlgL